jgi:hypothetical protein
MFNDEVTPALRERLEQSIVDSDSLAYNFHDPAITEKKNPATRLRRRWQG